MVEVSGVVTDTANAIPKRCGYMASFSTLSIVHTSDAHDDQVGNGLDYKCGRSTNYSTCNETYILKFVNRRLPAIEKGFGIFMKRRSFLQQAGMAMSMSLARPMGLTAQKTTN